MRTTSGWNQRNLQSSEWKRRSKLALPIGRSGRLWRQGPGTRCGNTDLRRNRALLHDTDGPFLGHGKTAADWISDYSGHSFLARRCFWKNWKGWHFSTGGNARLHGFNRRRFRRSKNSGSGRENLLPPRLLPRRRETQGSVFKNVTSRVKLFRGFNLRRFCFMHPIGISTSFLCGIESVISIRH